MAKLVLIVVREADNVSVPRIVVIVEAKTAEPKNIPVPRIIGIIYFLKIFFIIFKVQFY